MSLEAYTVINLILSYLIRASLKWAERQRLINFPCAFLQGIYRGLNTTSKGSYSFWMYLDCFHPQLSSWKHLKHTHTSRKDPTGMCVRLCRLPAVFPFLIRPPWSPGSLAWQRCSEQKVTPHLCCWWFEFFGPELLLSCLIRSSLTRMEFVIYPQAVFRVKMLSLPGHHVKKFRERRQ